MTDQQLLEAQRRLQAQHGKAPPAPDPGAAQMVAGLIDMVAAKAEAGAETETEYLDETTGLLRCRVCGGKRQTIITPPFEGAQPRTVRCWCQCPTTQDVAKAREKQIKMEQRTSVCFQGTEELKKEIQEYVKRRTAPYKYPRIVEFREDLPKTTSGKIIRKKL